MLVDGMGNISTSNTNPFAIWLDEQMSSRSLSNGELARECAKIAKALQRGEDGRRTKNGNAHIAVKEIGEFRKGWRRPGAAWAYRLGVGLRHCNVRTTGLRSLWTAAKDGLRPGHFVGSKDPLDALFVVAMSQIPKLLEAAERGLTSEQLGAFDDGYALWLQDEDTSKVSASARALYAMIKAAAQRAWSVGR